MNSISKIAIEIYQKLSKNNRNFSLLREATKNYILNEITHWTIKSVEQGDNYFYRPKEFLGDEKSLPFEVRLVKSNSIDGYHELKFGNLNAKTDEERYRWDAKDPYKLQKALFLMNVLENKIKSLFDSGKIIGIMFQPYSGDGLEDDRYSYFYNMYTKLGKDKYDLEKGGNEIDGIYTITKK